MRRALYGVGLAAIAGLGLASIGASVPESHTVTRRQPFQSPAPRASDNAITAHVTEPGRVVAEAAWEPWSGPLELSLLEWTATACTRRGTGRATCAAEITRDDLQRVGGVVVVQARIAEVEASVPSRGTLALTYPVPELRTTEWLFTAPDPFRTAFVAPRVGPLVVELAWAHEPGEEPSRADDAELRLEVRGPYVQGYGGTVLSRSGHSPLRIEHTLTAIDTREGGHFQVIVTPLDAPPGRVVRRATAALRVTLPVAR